MSRNRTSAKRAGSSFEQATVDYLKKALNQPAVNRMPMGGSKDRGDVGNVHTRAGSLVTVECRNESTRRIALGVGNANLTSAKRAKNDEFYTRMPDIENELRHYSEHFKGRTVLCNCDDPYESNFFRYFALNFNHLGLKKLMATSYCGSPIAGAEYQPSRCAT